MKTPNFQDVEIVKVNHNFANANVMVNFIPPTTHKKKDKEEDSKGNAGAEAADEREIRIERQNIIDAVIVRIMKARKTEKHNQLLEDVVKQVTIFMPQP